MLFEGKKWVGTRKVGTAVIKWSGKISDGKKAYVKKVHAIPVCHVTRSDHLMDCSFSGKVSGFYFLALSFYIKI